MHVEKYMRPKYRPVDALKSPRFCGISTFARLPHVTDLKGVDVAIVGVPFDDGTTFRSGARFGPQSIRELSRLLRPYNPYLKVYPFEGLNVVDYGDIDVVPGYIEDTYARIEYELDKITSINVVPVIMGGDHSTTLPVLRSLAKKHGKISLIHVDAHFDCWNEYFGRKYNHGTVFRRAVEEGLIEPSSSVHVGVRGSVFSDRDFEDVREMGFNIITAEEIHDEGATNIAGTINNIVKGRTYLSFDIDALDPSIAPGTGTPEVGGLSTAETLKLLRMLKEANFVGFDLVEVSPPYDHSGITALAGANIIYEFISLLAFKK